MRQVLLFSIIFSIGFLLFLFHLIRKKHLKEQYALLWLLFALSMIVLSLNPSWIEVMADWLNIAYAPALLFLVGIIFSFVLILHLTAVVSKLSDRVVRLTQELAILRNEMKEREKGSE